MEKVIARGRYDERNDPGIQCTLEEKVTKQHFTDDCNIDKILEKFSRTGQLPDQKPKQYGDFSNVPDYQTALQTVIKAQDQFYSLDAKVRQKFNNDPEAFLEFASNSENMDEMVKLGLAEAKVDHTPYVRPDSAALEAARIAKEAQSVSEVPNAK